jgi:large subunit ribosomal protein L25
MEKIILKAVKRTESPKKVRNTGFIPGVLNEHDTTSTPVQFDGASLSKILIKHGPNAKLWVEMGTKKRFGFIKEVQKHPVEGKVLHVSIQLLAKDEAIKMHLPLQFHGIEQLTHRSLRLHVVKTDIEVEGNATLMPDAIAVDVSERHLDDTVTAAEFHLPADIRISDAKDQIYAVIKAARGEVVAEPAEGKEATPVA